MYKSKRERENKCEKLCVVYEKKKVKQPDGLVQPGFFN
jgi:hypothetical protein